MKQLLTIAILGGLLAACSAGGEAVSMGSRRWRANWPEIGVDRYEAVVYPATPMQP